MVVAGVAADQIVAGAAADRVRPCVAEQHVAAVSTDLPVVARATLEVVTQRAPGEAVASPAADGEIERGGTPDEPVVAAAQLGRRPGAGSESGEGALPEASRAADPSEVDDVVAVTHDSVDLRDFRACDRPGG